jgi:phosphatidylserine/phosphatidylglycerophosphate/cardiolipin synthase-like enzyme
MRFKNTGGYLKIFAVAGTQTVLFSLDIAKTRVQGKKLIGFSFERKDKDGQVKKLNGTKRFLSLSGTAKKNLSLVQTYFWKDYTADPGETYSYTIEAMFGTADNFAPGYKVSIKVTTEALQQGMHGVYFNYGVTGSQAYANRFGDKHVDDLPAAKKKQAMAMLGRELWQDGLIEFVQQAKDNSYELAGLFYEFQYNDFLLALKKARQNGVTVNIRYSAKEGQKEKNEAAIAAAGIQSFCDIRTKVSQPHNKFMVLSRNGVPIEVWTGSTNITLQGIFGHSNTGHWIKDPAVAEKYFQYWNAIKDNPSVADSAVVSEAIKADTDLRSLKNGTHVFFSPRSSETLLTHYANLIDSAEKMACMIIPFNIDDLFRDVYAQDKDYLRYILFEKAAEAKSVQSNDTDLMITAGAILKSPVEQWVKEISSKTSTGAGILYVHNKFFLIDPLEKVPVVVTGSANFSKSSITRNDENTLIIKGDQRVADIYLTEFSRMFEHFWPRYLSTLPVRSFSKPLDEGYTWHLDYYNPKKMGLKRKKVFSAMKDAKES